MTAWTNDELAKIGWSAGAADLVTATRRRAGPTSDHMGSFA